MGFMLNKLLLGFLNSDYLKTIETAQLLKLNNLNIDCYSL